MRWTTLVALFAAMAFWQSQASGAGSDHAAAAGNWMTDGHGYDAQRYSPLARINERNVGRLGLQWFYDLDTLRGVEATPLAIDGVLYDISAWDITYAFDVKSGSLLWSYDPQVPKEWGRYACCEPVSRGLAWWQGHVIIATLDGRLISLDARTGKPVWTAQTFEKTQPYSITGAPRVFDGKVVVGNGGGDFGARGFVSAWDAATGAFTWRFYIVPGDPAKGFENAAMEQAAKTWHGEWWTLGGGGGAWDSIVYDPQLKLVYFGTGNGTPLAQDYRSPGGGDNLYLCSVVAVDANTGEYRWHYQEVPGEEWDYDCTESLILADLKIDGQPRKVLLHAPKDGYFYLFDRSTGKVISAKNYVPVNWALGIDPTTGAPQVNPLARYGTDPVLITPGPGGGHNWFAMAFSPKTRLAYFPAFEQWFPYAKAESFEPKPFRSNPGWGGFTGPALEKRKVLQKEADPRQRAWLMAWDPVKQRSVWEVPLPRSGNGGVLTTAGNLVVEGTTRQTLTIFRATDGKQLWEMPVQSAPVAAPISFLVGDEQYIAINAGWGGGAAQIERATGTAMNRAAARLLVFKLGGNRQLPPLPPATPTVLTEPPPLTVSEVAVKHGAELFANNCAVCHGQMAVGGVKDLRYMDARTHASFPDIVLKGIRSDRGMASFAKLLSPDDVDAIHGYIISRAQEDWGHQNEHQ
ncbi:MAG TPA: PQQ-dependent dehydrogenase, methanol/ethanol family [Steroidobacteraceae bacterium]|nr:PQQ-dependent dehydrogenase, methanol/ethanol family [Steroidobacteraceae bacterium]